MKAILRSSIFQVNTNGHGGNRRTAQIQELVNQAGLEITDVRFEAIQRRKKYINGIKFLSKYKILFFPSYRVVSACGHQYKIYQNYLSQHQGAKILLWESTANYIPLYVAQEENFKIIALPHNIESLVVGHLDQFSRKTLPESLENEIKHLAKANAVFCISREEQWFLKLRGINADYLPYYPNKSILNNLLEIRKYREKSQFTRFLILGTADNPPTYLGMIEQIHWLSEIAKYINFQVDIAGYGTEKLKGYCQSSNITLHGTVEAEKLKNLMISAKAILVHQQAGVGALTRIPEMIIAGIPVIANSNTCRSAFSYPGIYCYDYKEELMDLMSKNLDVPAILERPIVAEKRLIERLKQLAYTFDGN